MNQSDPRPGTSPQFPLCLPLALRLLRRVEFPHRLGVLERLFGRALARHEVAWVRSAVGPVWKLDLANVTHRWIVYGLYEGPALWRWLAQAKNSPWTIVDSGANIGQTVLHFAALAPYARIIAYEPGATARAWLEQGVAANRLHQVRVCTTALGAAPARMRLRDEGGPGRHGSWNKVSETEGEPIEVVRLDDEIARLGLETIDLWKLDMEGYELPALRGATQALRKAAIGAIYIEAGGTAGQDSISFLRDLGYRVLGLTPQGKTVEWQPLNDYDCALCLAPGKTPPHDQPNARPL